MRLLHYSHEPLPWPLKPFKPQPDTPEPKPLGMWVSVEGEDDWPWWCEREGWGIGKICQEIVLHPEAKILLIDTLKKFDAFSQKWRMPKLYKNPALNIRGYALRWPEIAQQWHGIVIAPYQWKRRLADNCMWYYGYDCASGCIWSNDAIEKIIYLGEQHDVAGKGKIEASATS